MKYTRSQAQLVEEVLKQKGFTDTKCYFAMRYWHPFTEEVLDNIQKDEINTLVIVPLYPQFSISTSGSSLRLLQDIFYQNPQLWGPQKIKHTVVPSWYHRPGYITVMARLIVDQLKTYSSKEMKEGIHVLFSAHGVPISYIKSGDPYQRQIEECIRLISREVQAQLRSERSRPASISRKIALSLAGDHSSASSTAPSISTESDKVVALASELLNVSTSSNEFPPIKFHLSFQSRVGPVQWLKPYTEEILVELGQEGVKNLIVVPVSFVSEHIETLEEIDMEYKELAEDSGIHNWRRVPALNTDASFINDMADLVVCVFLS